MAVFSTSAVGTDIAGTIDASANQPFGKNHRGKRKCVGSFASRQRGTHLQVTLEYVENPPFPKTAIWHSLICMGKGAPLVWNLCTT